MAVLGGSLLAYQDPVYAAPLAACALLLASGRHAWAWLAYAFALLVKPQPLVAAPVLFLASVARRSLSRLVGYVSGAASLGLLFVLPFVLGGTFINFLANFLRNATETYLSAYNCNLWWLATYGRQVRLLTEQGTELSKALQTTTEYTFAPRLIAAGLPDPRPWALGFFVVFTAVVLITWWLRFGNTDAARSGVSPAIAEVLALQLYGATMLLTQVHENHAYGAAALLVATWWVFTPVPWSVTGFLPLVLFPLGGVLSFNATAALYGQRVLPFVLGVMLFGHAFQKHGLARRMAVTILSISGVATQSIEIPDSTDSCNKIDCSIAINAPMRTSDNRSAVWTITSIFSRC
jgi:hypothetical protein